MQYVLTEKEMKDLNQEILDKKTPTRKLLMTCTKW